jgi:sentrin-specific protease 7
LIFDSLAGASRSRVVATLRDYLTCEYKAKVMAQTSHTFNKDNMPGCCVKVPQQNNFTDCGLYLLQYVEEFFSHPIKDFRLPVRSLQNWFETIVVTRKREEIQYPTLNGKLLEREDEEAEFEEEELEEDPNDPTYSTENESSPEKATKSNARGSKNITTAAATSTTNNENNQSTSNSSTATTKKTLFKRTLEDKPRTDTSGTRKRNRISET